MSRGYLIRPLTAEIARLDTAATATAGGYDPVLHIVRPTSTGYGGVPGKARVELAPVRVPAQVEMGAWERRQQAQAGDQPDSRLTLVLHYTDLEALGLLDASGRAAFRKGDRLHAIYSADGVLLEELVRAEAGGLYVTEVQPAGFGLGGRRNLCLLTFDERPQGRANFA